MMTNSCSPCAQSLYPEGSTDGGLRLGNVVPDFAAAMKGAGGLLFLPAGAVGKQLERETTPKFGSARNAL